MGTSRNSVGLAVAFFCTLGWVCNGPAIGAEPVNGADPTCHHGEVGLPVPSRPVSSPGALFPADNAPAVAPVSTVAAAAVAPGGTVATDKPAAPAKVSVHFDTVSLNVQNTDLASVLQLLSIQSKRNIVPSPKVSGTVTANLYDVTFREALDAILQQNGCGYIEKGNFIYVYTLDELKKIQDAEHKPVSRIFRLNYITAKDASTFVQPLLSSSGAIALSGVVAAGFQPTTSDGGANSYAHVETMIVRDFPEHLDEVAKILKQLDTPPTEVLVEATVLDAELDNQLAMGVDLAYVGGNLSLSTLAGPASGAVDSLVNPTSAALTTNVSDIVTNQNVRLGLLTHNIGVFIKALDQVTDTTILANPKILTLNRQRATILVGKKVAYLSSTATATSTTQTVEFLDTGTQLSLRPFVSDDGMIRMELKPSISDAQLRTAGSGSGTVTLPDQTTQELTTNVMVRDGQTVVLGGLFKEQTTVDRSQVPGVGDLPIVGNAFKANNNEVKRSEIIFLITPHIVKEKALAAAGQVAANDVATTAMGAREELLPWSRDKLTAGHVRDALKDLSENKKDKALYEVDQALNLNPRFTEARRLKESLTGQRVYQPGYDMLDDAIGVMIQQQTGHRPQPPIPVVPAPGPTLPKVPAPHAAPVPPAPVSEAPTAAPKPEEASAPVPAPVPAVKHDIPTHVTAAREPAQPAAAAQVKPVVDVIPTPAKATAPAATPRSPRSPNVSSPAAPDVKPVAPDAKPVAPEAKPAEAPAVKPEASEAKPTDTASPAKASEASPAENSDAEPAEGTEPSAKPMDPRTDSILHDFGSPSH